MIDEHLIWDLSRIDHERKRLEFTNVIRFKGQWFCSFREADYHGSHPSARMRLLRSDDWKNWESVALFTWDGSDLRDPQLSITAEGLLMINSSIVFGTTHDNVGQAVEQGYVPREVADEIGDMQPLFVPNEQPGWKLDPVEAEGVFRQSVTWLSSDGVNWSGAHCCPTGINTWRWAVTWHNGMGYSVARGKGRDEGQLFRTRDGKSWRLLATPLFPQRNCNEATVAFDDDHTAWCIVRYNPTFAVLGSAHAPHYQDWTWRPLQHRALDGEVTPAEQKLGVQLGGPKMIRLSDGRFVMIGRTDAGGLRGEVTPAGDRARISVFEVDVENAILNEWVEIDARTYPGIDEHDGVLHLSFGRGNGEEVWVARMDIPPKS